jgi:hypothetical protein
MQAPFKFYLQHMHSQSNYRATWDPAVKLKLGYVGKLQDGVLDVFTTLEKEGINMEVSEESSVLDLDYTSHKSVNIDSKLSGSAPIAGSVLTELDAGFALSFKSDKAVVFKVAGYKTHQIVNLKDIEKAVLDRYNGENLNGHDEWDKDWVVVTRIVEADSSTIIISTSSNSQLDLKAKANVGAANLKITDAALGLSIVKETGSNMNFIAKEGLTPLYRVMGIRKPWIGSAKFKAKNVPTPPDGAFEEQPFDDEEIIDE